MRRRAGRRRLGRAVGQHFGSCAATASPSRRRAIPRRRWSRRWKSSASAVRRPMPPSITTIQDREYVRKDKNRLIPEDKGRHRHDLPAELLQALHRIRFHRRARGGARPCQRRRGRLQRRADAVLARFLGRDRRNIRTAHHRGAGRARRRARAAALSAARGRERSAHLSALRRGPAAPQDLALGRVRRLRPLPRMPLHPPHRAAMPPKQGTAFWARTMATRSRCARAGSGLTCSVAR